MVCRPKLISDYSFFSPWGEQPKALSPRKEYLLSETVFFLNAYVILKFCVCALKCPFFME